MISESATGRFLLVTVVSQYVNDRRFTDALLKYDDTPTAVFNYDQVCTGTSLAS